MGIGSLHRLTLFIRSLHTPNLVQMLTSFSSKCSQAHEALLHKLGANLHISGGETRCNAPNIMKLGTGVDHTKFSMFIDTFSSIA